MLRLWIDVGFLFLILIFNLRTGLVVFGIWRITDYMFVFSRCWMPTERYRCHAQCVYAAGAGGARTCGCAVGVVG